MPSTTCVFCGETYQTPRGGARLVILRAESGYLVLAGYEQVLHRCGSLTSDDESMLLRDAGWIIDNPDEGPASV